MNILTTVKETLDSGDPLVRSWVLVNSYYTPFVASLMYVLVVKRFGPYWMENRKPFDLRLFMIFYNFSIVLTYSTCILTLVYYFLTTDAYKLMCEFGVVEKDHYTYWGACCAWYIYTLKYVEYADTIFFILRKKNHLVTNLHVIHHAVLPIIGWILMRTETSGFQFIPGAINSCIHIIMYTYYGLAAMGPAVQKYLWWKEYLTKLQMLQFIIILLFVFLGIPLIGCKTSTHGIYIDIFFAILFLGLFYNFYVKTYKKTPISRNRNGVVKLETNGNGHYSYQNGSSTVKNAEYITEHVKSS